MSLKKLTLVPFGSLHKNDEAIDVFDDETLLGIIGVYSHITRTENPCIKKLPKGQKRRVLEPELDIDGIRKELRDGHTWCPYEFDFCSASNKATVLLHQVVVGDLLYVGVEFSPDSRGSGNDHAAVIVLTLHRELQKYIDRIVKSRTLKNKN